MADETKNIIEFFELTNGLKRNKRTGWATRNVQDSESIADHSWRMALMALVLSKKNGIDENRAVKMALIHDLPEAITGDIARDNIDEYGSNIGIKPSMSCEQKRKNEENALGQMAKLLGKKARNEIVSLWEEYEERKTKAARFVKDLDRLECMMQALEYKRAHPDNKLLDDFYMWYGKFGKAENPEIKVIVEKIMKEFEALMKEK